MVESLTIGQYSLVANLMSLTVATMGASALFFFLSRGQVAPKLRPALTVSGLVVSIAAYHYWRILESWQGSYELVDGMYAATGKLFNDAYRYADWTLTVPLLVIELVLVMALAKEESRSLMTKLSLAALAMIALGYPGEISADPTIRWVFWGLSMVFWVYIMFVLFTRFGQAVARQPAEVQPLIKNARLLILITWAFYPIAYLGPEFGFTGPTAEVFVQVGYTIADIVAKAGLGLFIYWIARRKSEAEGYEPGEIRAAGA